MTAYLPLGTLPQSKTRGQGKHLSGVLNSREISLYPFASKTKPVHTLTHWNFGFKIVTSKLKYVCHLRECSSTIAKFVVSATLIVSIIINSQGINNLAQQGILIFFYGKFNTKQGNYISFTVKSLHLQHIFS